MQNKVFVGIRNGGVGKVDGVGGDGGDDGDVPKKKVHKDSKIR